MTQLTDLLADMLDGETSPLLRQYARDIAEIRLRIGRPAMLCLLGGVRIPGGVVTVETFRRTMNRLMGNSMYACERQLQQGYFTSLGGCRVGVCGRINAGRQGVDGLGSISSACIRIPRQVKGCAAPLAKYMLTQTLGSMLIVSLPGMGKTTLLRDLVRILADAGRNVCIADERREIAACLDGVPQLDVGRCCDVMDGLEKSLAIPMLIRACAPELIAVDELGGEDDALAVLHARRCGVAVAATVHARNLEAAASRPCIAMLLREGVFDYAAVLGPVPGKIESVHESGIARYQYAQNGIADDHTPGLHGCGQGDVHAQKASL